MESLMGYEKQLITNCKQVIELCERSLANDGNGREMRFTGGDVVAGLIPTIQEWIPVSERLPEPLTEVLSYGHGCFEVNMADGGVWDSEYYSEYSVTHWMPLPEPPKGEE